MFPECSQKLLFLEVGVIASEPNTSLALQTVLMPGKKKGQSPQFTHGSINPLG
jgi:hypothetical protein